MSNEESKIEDSPSVVHGPYETRFGRYARRLLIPVVAALLVWFVYRSFAVRLSTIPLIASSVLLFSLFVTRGPQVLRIAPILAMTINAITLVVNPNEISYGYQGSLPLTVSRIVLAVCMTVASFFEINAWIRSSTRETIIKTLSWSLLAIPPLVYIVGMPLFSAVMESFSPEDVDYSTRDPNWKWWNESSFRAAKFSVFGAFTYLGACLGSFLNVAAYCIPHGKPLGLRDSKCPKCDTKIARVDNLPIFSYVNLGGRCRHCRSVISIRYFLVELVAAGIFGSLFLYQLVTGCINIPSMRTYTHAGVLWMILYPKWPALGLYFFHTLFLCVTLTLSLIEWDKEKIKARFGIGLCVAFMIAAVIYFPLQPVELPEHVPNFSLQLTPLVSQLVRVVAGGIVGAVIGSALASFLASSHSRFVFVTAYALTGIVLGWQGLLQVTLIFGALSSVRLFSSRFDERPTSLLLIALIIHHPFWKLISGLW